MKMLTCRKHPQEELILEYTATGESFINEFGEEEYKFYISDAECHECNKGEHKWK
jgi:hypothetical protein